MEKRQVTLSDLAKALGISTATVSRALKDYPDISAETKRKVLALAKEWNYHPNSIAAGLRKKESRMIGVIIPEIVNHFFSTVIKGIMEIAYEAGYNVMLCQSDESYKKEVKDAKALLQSRVDGVMISVAHETVDFDHFKDFQAAGIPIVFFDKVCEELHNTSKIQVDDFQGAFNATAHLIEQGYQHIVHIKGPVNATTSKYREKGYLAALEEYKMPIRKELIIDGGFVMHEDGVRIGKQLALGEMEVDAIFGVTDIVAIGAMVGIKSVGKKIPDDIAVIGFSDWLMTTVVEPKLSSVAQPGYEMGKVATNVLLKEIKYNRENIPFIHENIFLETELKIRSSSDPKRKFIPNVSQDSRS